MLFDSEHRDAKWAAPTEAYLRVRVDKLAELDGVRVVEVECRTTCCMIRFPPSEQFGLDLQSSAGVPLEKWTMGQDFLATCYDRGKPFPPEDFVDRLDERVALARIVAKARTECRSASGAPGAIDMWITIKASGEVLLVSGGDLLGTSAVGCVEDFLYREIRFGPAETASALQVSIDLGGQ